MNRTALPLATLLVLTACSRSIDRFDEVSADPLEAPLRTSAQHDSVMEGREWPYVLELRHPSGGALLYYGSWHTTDPDDPQIADMERRWAEFRPTVALTENTGGRVLGWTQGRAIRTLGEFAVPILLAGDAGVPVWSLEPSWEAELASVTERYSPEEALVFYTLRVWRSERGDRTGEAAEDLLLHLLEKRSRRPGLEGRIEGLAAFDSVWSAAFADAVGDWRTMPPEALWPRDDGHRLQRLSTVVNHARDRHMIRVILHHLERGERVFAVAGGSHVVIQEPALRAASGSDGEGRGEAPGSPPPRPEDVEALRS